MGYNLVLVLKKNLKNLLRVWLKNACIASMKMYFQTLATPKIKKLKCQYFFLKSQ
jgi:hypothetical protein